MRPTFKGNSYTLSPVAETGERFSDFVPYVAAVDNRGIVAFQAALAGGGSGVYTSDEGRVTTIAESATGPFGGVCSHPDINPGGSCCFYAGLEPEGQAVLLVRGGVITFLADAAGPLGPTMNEAGTLAFRASTAEGADGVFLFDSGIVATIADTTGRFTRFHGLPVVAGDGTVLFRADVDLDQRRRPARGARGVARRTPVHPAGRPELTGTRRATGSRTGGSPGAQRAATVMGYVASRVPFANVTAR